MSKELQVQGLRLRRYELNQQRMKDDAAKGGPQTHCGVGQIVNNDAVKISKLPADRVLSKPKKPELKASSREAKAGKPGKPKKKIAQRAKSVKPKK